MAAPPPPASAARLGVVGMADGDRQGIGGVGRLGQTTGQQHADHHLDLLLVGMAGADHRFLDQIGRIFGDRQAGERRHQQHHAAGDAQLQGRGRVLVDEGLLDRGGDGLILLDHRAQAVVQLDQALGQRQRSPSRMDGAVRHMS